MPTNRKGDSFSPETTPSAQPKQGSVGSEVKTPPCITMRAAQQKETQSESWKNGLQRKPQSPEHKGALGAAGNWSLYSIYTTHCTL